MLTGIFPLCLMLYCCFVCLGNAQSPFVEEPETQYVLNGMNATFTCKARTSNQYWVIGDDATSGEHTDVQLRYEMMGFIFENNAATLPSDYITYTLTIPASTSTNNTLLRCKVWPHSYRDPVSSDNATLVVWTSLNPLKPNVSIENRDALSITLTWLQPLLWPGHPITQHNITMTNATGKYSETILRNRSSSSGSWSIQRNSIAQNCSVVTFELTAVNKYGTSESAIVTGGYPIKPDGFSVKDINGTTYFHSNTTPFVELNIKLPTLCTYQYLNYTVIVEETLNGNQLEVMRIGPKHILYQNTIREEVTSGLKRDHHYSVRVIVDTIAGSIESGHSHFDTFLMVKNSNNIIYIAVMGACIGLAVLMFLIAVITLVSYVKSRRKKGTTRNNGPSSQMIPNPIYDGPIYDSVHQSFNVLPDHKIEQAAASTTTNDNNFGSASTPLTPTPDNNNVTRYLDNPVQPARPRTNTIAYSRQVPSSSVNSPAFVHRSASISVPSKNPSHNRNKLHLTLSLENKPLSFIATSALSGQDDNYTIMSPAGALGGSTLGGGWGEPSPEDTTKYQE